MVNHESPLEKAKTMPCGPADQSIAELEKQGWEYEWSFHLNDRQQWNDACEQVESLQKYGFWECVLVYGQDEIERKDGVAYIYKKKRIKQNENTSRVNEKSE